MSSHHPAPGSHPSAELDWVPSRDSQTRLLSVGAANSTATQFAVNISEHLYSLRPEDKSYPLLVSSATEKKVCFLAAALTTSTIILICTATTTSPPTLSSLPLQLALVCYLCVPATDPRALWTWSYPILTTAVRMLHLGDERVPSG